jgi:FdhD protein
VTIDDQEMTASENSEDFAVRINLVRRPSLEIDSDLVVAEGPLEISVDGKSFALTMRTPGHDLELVSGFLYCEGCIEESEDIAAIEIVGENSVDVRFATGISIENERFLSAQRSRYASSACGVCSRATIDQLMDRIEPLAPIDLIPSDVLQSLPERMRPAQKAFAETGGIHAAALFDTEGYFMVLREDVGRHNAVDKVIGWSLSNEDIELEQTILMVSGRIGFEIVQKAAVARIPVIAAIGAPSSMAVELANGTGMQMYGFVGNNRCNQYSPVDG